MNRTQHNKYFMDFGRMAWTIPEAGIALGADRLRDMNRSQGVGGPWGRRPAPGPHKAEEARQEGAGPEEGGGASCLVYTPAAVVTSLPPNTVSWRASGSRSRQLHRTPSSSAISGLVHSHHVGFFKSCLLIGFLRLYLHMCEIAMYVSSRNSKLRIGVCFRD